MAKSKGKGPSKGAAVKGRKPAREDPMAFKRASRVSRITNAQDAGFEGQDAFGMGDDEISLNDRSNGVYDDIDDDLDENEVLALNIPEREESYSDEDNDEEIDAAHAGPSSSGKIKKTRLSNQAKDLLPLEPKTKTSRYAKLGAGSPESSGDSEAAAASQGDSDSDSDEDNEGEGEDEFNDEWARTGGYHVSRKEIARLEDQAASASSKPYVDEEDAQRDALELYEARRIQKEAKDRLSEEDYMNLEELDADDAEDTEALQIAKPERRYLPAGLIFETREEAIAHLVSKEPELLALVDDFSATSDKLPIIQQTVLDIQKAAKEDNPKVGFAYLYQELTSTYLTLLAFYLHIRSHSAYPAAGGSMADTVLARLAKVREYISTLDDLGIIDLPGDQPRQDLYIGENGDDSDDLENLDREALMARIGDLDDDELDALIAERQAMLQEEASSSSAPSKSSALTSSNAKEKKRKLRNVDAEDFGIENDAADDTGGPKRKRKRPGKGSNNVNKSLLNLELPPISSKGAALVSAPTGRFDDFVEPTSLSAAEASEKAGKKKSLRFYTSKIDATAARRSGAGKERGGGDDDVPYRSKERAREAALKRQQHLQGQAAANSDLDSADFDDADFALAQQVNENMREADSYYDMVANSKKAAKEAKKDAYDEASLHDRAANAGVAPLDSNNPRAVNRLIMANKGLTPKRPKSVRNPRVKKRQRYEQAQKKVASMKPVYKGGLGSAAYQGEKTGISKVVKSRSL